MRPLPFAFRGDMPRTKFTAPAGLSSVIPGICHMPTFMRFLVPLLVSGLFLAGCSSMKPYNDSPQYDESRNRFEHPAGYRNDKGLFDVLGLAGAFLTREDDPARKSPETSNGTRKRVKVGI